MDMDPGPSAPLDTQQLLFDAGGPLARGAIRRDALDEFEERGWVWRHGVPDVHRAMDEASSILAMLDRSHWGRSERLSQALRLAKADRFPTCEPSIHESFQALHFDMGLPLVERPRQSAFLASMLYVPLDREPGTALTRIVSVRGLLGQRSFGAVRACDDRLKAYADAHGDGWRQPRRHITGRLGCLARVVDAMLEEPELTALFDRATWEWFRDGPASEDGEVELSREVAWWARHGYAVEDVETRIQLRPGDLLLIDNVRCAHGRIGSRRAEELWQVMWGVQHVDADEIADLRHFLSAALSGGTRTRGAR